MIYISYSLSINYLTKNGIWNDEKRLKTSMRNFFSAGIDFRRQNLMSKVDPRAERAKISMAVDP